MKARRTTTDLSVVALCCFSIPVSLIHADVAAFSHASEPQSDDVLAAQAYAPWGGSAIVHGFDAQAHVLDVTVHWFDARLPGDTRWFVVTGRLQSPGGHPGS